FASVLFLWLMGNALKNNAQTQEPISANATELFNLAAAKHKRELSDLRGTRGLPLIYLPNASAESIAKVLRAKDTDRDFSREATYQEKTAVLFYSYEQASLQIWLVDEQGIQAYHRREILPERIDELAINLRSAMRVDFLQVTRSPQQRSIQTAVPISGNSQIPPNQAIAELTEVLLPKNVADKLASVRHLIIVPVLGLGTIPYPMLQPFNDQSFLIDKMSIAIAPSLFDVGAYVTPWNAKAAFSSPLIIGNPYLPKNPDWIVPPLPGAESEVNEVAKLINTIPFIGKIATKDLVVSKAPNSSLLYFATHGIASSNNPLTGGFLMLSAQQLEQGWWTAKEVQEMKLQLAEIAVLSACQTGLGKNHDAGVIGLARAFQIAGVPRVVISLWSVDDRATSYLMKAFMQNLQNDMPAEALRKAMLEARKQHPDPAKWASFVLFGTPR
ncbi:MAG TPA: CHAT domain-containing protein, partial [Phormidium sp.]